MDEDLETMVAEEFKHLGFRAHTRDVSNLADALRKQAVELGDIGVMAACVGYITARIGNRWV